LYSVFNDDISFLITEDIGIHKKAYKLSSIKENFNERIFTISKALNYFNKKLPLLPPIIENTTANSLNIDDSIFDTLKEDYPDFNAWFKKISGKRIKFIFNIFSNLFNIIKMNIVII